MKKLYMLVAVVLLMVITGCSSGDNALTPATVASLSKTGQTVCYDAGGAVIACVNTGQDGDLQKGVAWPSSRFTDNGDQTITDNLNGLMWTQDGNAPGPSACTPGITKTWQEALDYAACLNTNTYLGHNDWRLPNRKELRSLVNYSQSDSAAWLNNASQGFSNVQATYYWSSTTYAPNTIYAWVVNMNGGYVDYGGKAGGGYYVWPVRAGQSGTVNLPKTGQTTSYATGDDGNLQKGVTWPTPRFTDNGDQTITDNLTALMWTKDGNAPGTACTPGAVKTWQGALDYAACLNTNNYLGHNDWRLPNVNELESLVHSGQSNIATWLNTQGFSNVQADWYWSSTTHVPSAVGTWIVDMGTGYVGANVKGNSDYVWPVRAGQ
jgi:hypothetical protein